MKIERDKVVFSSGKIKNANCGIIGISPSLEITNGYDGGFHSMREEWMSDEDYECLTKEEQIELADYMIAEWQRFKDQAA